MLSGLDIAISLTGAVLEIALAIVLIRQRLWRKAFPLFFLYVCYAVVDAVGIILISTFSSKRTYASAYWIMQAVYAILGLLAMNESFQKIFRVYYFRSKWFRFIVPGVVLTILSISIWNWQKHAPIQAGPETIAYMSFDLAANYMRGGVFGLFGILVFFWRAKWLDPPFGILLGFGTFSVIGMIADALRSDFGKKMDPVFIYAAAVAYIVACAIWLQAFKRSQEDRENVPRSAVDPSELLQLLDHHTEILNKTKDQERH